MSYEHVRVERRGAVGVVTLDRPEALNALSTPLLANLAAALRELVADDAVGAVVLTGSERAFAAGADIKEMQDKSYMDVYLGDYFGDSLDVSACPKPTVAAVAGFALGGGCELAMMCDFIIAADNARFGQPEVKIGVLPGLGGTQRLTRVVGKSKAMEMCLTGRMMDAEEAERAGLVSRIVPSDALVEEAVKAAQTMATMSRPSVRMIREAINRAYETTLAEGLLFERRLFFSAFATEDQQEGMRAFVEKRPPAWKHR